MTKTTSWTLVFVSSVLAFAWIVATHGLIGLAYATPVGLSGFSAFAYLYNNGVGVPSPGEARDARRTNG